MPEGSGPLRARLLSCSNLHNKAVSMVHRATVDDKCTFFALARGSVLGIEDAKVSLGAPRTYLTRCLSLQLLVGAQDVTADAARLPLCGLEETCIE